VLEMVTRLGGCFRRGIHVELNSSTVEFCDHD
jgi:hypothetical protein